MLIFKYLGSFQISFYRFLYLKSAFLGGASSKEPACQCRDIRDAGSIPGLGRSPEREHGNPIQYSWLENPMDRGAWRAAVHGVAESQTWLSACAHTHTHTHQWYTYVNPNLSIHSSTFPLGVHMFVFSEFVYISVLQITSSIPFF